MTQPELEFLDAVIAGTSAASKGIVLDASSKIDAIDITTLTIGGTAVSATAAEINNAADVSGRTDTEATSGAQVVAAGVQSLEFNNVTQITSTIADASNHQGLFIVKQIDAGTAGHTLTLTSGTFNGTNNVATLNADNEALVVYFDSNGDGTIIENVGSVALS
jgi:hypothetical protein